MLPALMYSWSLLALASACYGGAAADGTTASGATGVFPGTGETTTSTGGSSLNVPTSMSSGTGGGSTVFISPTKFIEDHHF